jgi:hypothetical protein
VSVQPVDPALQPLPPVAQLEPDELCAPIAPPSPIGAGVRDRGMAMIASANKWLIGGAVALAGALSLVAAGTFKGHALRTGAAASSSAASQSGGGGGAAAPSEPNAGASLAPPDAAPAASVPTPAPVVSGGS